MPFPMNRTSSNAPKGKPSMAHPPAPKRKSFYGERPDDEQNSGRMTGPPMQMGPGKNSMFADGRRGQPQGARPMSPNMGAPGPGPMHARGQMQGNPPMTPNYPQSSVGPSRVSGQMQGVHPKGTPTAVMLADGRRPKKPDMMMADGFAAPEMMGAEPDADDQAPMDQAPPDAGGGSAGAGPLPMIRPEAVNYIDMPQPCKECAYADQQLNCSVLQMTVSDTGHCNAWEEGGHSDMMTNNGAPQSDIGTSDGNMGPA